MGGTLRSSILQARARDEHRLHIAMYNCTARPRATHNNAVVTRRIQQYGRTTDTTIKCGSGMSPSFSRFNGCCYRPLRGTSCSGSSLHSKHMFFASRSTIGVRLGECGEGPRPEFRVQETDRLLVRGPMVVQASICRPSCQTLRPAHPSNPRLSMWEWEKSPIATSERGEGQRPAFTGTRN